MYVDYYIPQHVLFVAREKFLLSGGWGTQRVRCYLVGFPPTSRNGKALATLNVGLLVIGALVEPYERSTAGNLARKKRCSWTKTR